MFMSKKPNNIFEISVPSHFLSEDWEWAKIMSLFLKFINED